MEEETEHFLFFDLSLAPLAFSPFAVQSCIRFTTGSSQNIELHHHTSCCYVYYSGLPTFLFINCSFSQNSDSQTPESSCKRITSLIHAFCLLLVCLAVVLMKYGARVGHGAERNPSHFWCKFESRRQIQEGCLYITTQHVF